MSLLDTYKTYNPVTLVVGCGFVAYGLWLVSELLLHGVCTILGGVFIFVFFICIPASLGIAIIHNQLRLRKNSK